MQAADAMSPSRLLQPDTAVIVAAAAAMLHSSWSSSLGRLLAPVYCLASRAETVWCYGSGGCCGGVGGDNDGD
jgi:hypothetical protein